MPFKEKPWWERPYRHDHLPWRPNSPWYGYARRHYWNDVNKQREDIAELWKLVNK